VYVGLDVEEQVRLRVNAERFGLLNFLTFCVFSAGCVCLVRSSAYRASAAPESSPATAPDYGFVFADLGSHRLVARSPPHLLAALCCCAGRCGSP
jgi:hypothetical protein